MHVVCRFLMAMQENTAYENGYTSESPQIRWFWAIVEDLSTELQGKLLQFATGTSRVPAAGFSALEGAAGPCRFSLYKYVVFLLAQAHVCRYEKLPALPRGHACFNRLDLPVYTSLEDVCVVFLFSS